MLQLLGSNMEAEEECRSVVADCLAQLAFMSPAALASWLLQQLSSESAGARGVAVAAMKYALNDSAHDASHLTQCATATLRASPMHACRAALLIMALASWGSLCQRAPLVVRVSATLQALICRPQSLTMSQRVFAPRGVMNHAVQASARRRCCTAVPVRLHVLPVPRTVAPSCHSDVYVNDAAIAPRDLGTSGCAMQHPPGPRTTCTVPAGICRCSCSGSRTRTTVCGGRRCSCSTPPR